MRKSARMLGKILKLTAEEMNQVLLKNGFLEGEPGKYVLTEKGEKYAIMDMEHSGTGGSLCYNRYWEWLMWDEAILDHIKVDADMINDIRHYLSARRAAQYAARKTAEKTASEAALAKKKA